MALSMWNDPFGANVFNDPFFSDWTTWPTATAWPTTATTTRRRRRRTTTTTWSPWSPLTTIGQAINDPDTDVGHWHFDYHLSEPVQLALEEYADKYVARIYHPGVAKEKLKLDVENDTLIVSGEYEPSEMEEKQPSEPLTRTQPRRLFRRFVRYMVLPDDADQSQISASHTQEYLEIIIKKISGAQQRQARIPIK